MQKYSAHVDAAVVYIGEAHAKEEWGLGSINGKYDVSKPTTNEERLNLARTFFADFGLYSVQQTVVDTIEDGTMRRYRALPERLYIVQDGHVALQGGPGPFDYDLGKLEAWLAQRFPDA